MLSLEVVDPGGSLSTVLIATLYRRDTSWRVSWQPATAMAAYKLRQDGYGARPSAGKRLAAAMARRTGIDGDGSNFIIILLVIIRLVFFSNSTFLIRHFKHLHS
jgi:hypothetical protein